MPAWLEFHDSLLQSIEVTDAAVSLQLSGYIHSWTQTAAGWNGVGLSQRVEITIESSEPPPLADGALPLRISEGDLKAADQRYGNLAPVPLDLRGSCVLQLVLESAGTVIVSGQHVRVETLDAGTFIEDLPMSLLPDELRTR
jgi:hypothetical protein